MSQFGSNLLDKYLAEAIGNCSKVSEEQCVNILSLSDCRNPLTVQRLLSVKEAQNFKGQWRIVHGVICSCETCCESSDQEEIKDLLLMSLGVIHPSILELDNCDKEMRLDYFVFQGNF